MGTPSSYPTIGSTLEVLRNLVRGNQTRLLRYDLNHWFSIFRGIPYVRLSFDNKIE